MAKRNVENVLANTDLPKDALWYEQIAIKIQPNPHLAKEGQDLIKREYQVELSKAMDISKAMLHYFLVDNNLPSKTEQLVVAKRNPWSYPTVVEFTDSVYAVLKNYR